MPLWMTMRYRLHSAIKNDQTDSFFDPLIWRRYRTVAMGTIRQKPGTPIGGAREATKASRTATIRLIVSGHSAGRTLRSRFEPWGDLRAQNHRMPRKSRINPGRIHPTISATKTPKPTILMFNSRASRNVNDPSHVNDSPARCCVNPKGLLAKRALRSTGHPLRPTDRSRESRAHRSEKPTPPANAVKHTGIVRPFGNDCKIPPP